MTDATRSPDCPDAETIDRMLDELTDHRTAASDGQRDDFDECMDVLASLQGRIEAASDLDVALDTSRLRERYNEAADHLALAGLNLYNFERRAADPDDDRSTPDVDAESGPHSESHV